ncbi:MAG: NADH-quinone oxidoreductase subunit L [Nitrososphaerota archaeon]|nr:NADH-quinone oxidoreductase subunit L [Nitrososphaerota archaeon]MDG7023976.1 NADH-quinone oxidoreductase subunit L [Nitrososphaerota archaeon]
MGSLATVALRKAGRLGDYAAVVFSFLSALFATTMVLPLLEGQALTVNSVPPLSTSVPWISGVNLTFGVLTDPYTAVLTSVVAWICFLIVLYSLEYMKDDGGHNRYFFFITLFIGSMQLIVLSDNLLSLFVGWEMVGLCSYALIGHYWKDETKDWVGTPGDKALGEDQAYSPSQAGMKAFVMTRIGDVAMLAGILVLFFYSGTFNYYQLAADQGSWFQHLYSNGLLVPVGLLIFGGAVGKSAQFPLHEWLPDAMAGPAPVSALIHAATMVKAGVVLVARIAPIFFFLAVANPTIGVGGVQPFFMTVAWIGAFTAILAASQSLVGFELKKILAYSTVSQIGYMMLAVGVAGLSTDFAQGLSAALYQLMSHAIFKATLFLTAGALIHAADSKYINDMGGMRDKVKITFAAFLISAASLSGIPPFSGFWSKDAVLGAAWSAGQYALFAVGAVTAGLTAFYSFRMLGLVFLGDRSKRLEQVEAQGHHVHEPSPIMWVPYSILAGLTVIIGLAATGGLVIPSLNVDASLQSFASTYIHSFFPAAALSAPSAALDAAPAGIGGLFVAIGFAIAAMIYLLRRTPPTRFVGQTGAMHGLYKFLYNRWYINAIYYKVFVNAPLAASRWLSDNFDYRGLFRINEAGSVLGVYLSGAGNWVDVNIVDGTANGFSSVGQALSRAFRKIETGILEQYALVFAVGVVLMVILLLAALWASGQGVPLP